MPQGFSAGLWRLQKTDKNPGKKKTAVLPGIISYGPQACGLRAVFILYCVTGAKVILFLKTTNEVKKLELTISRDDALRLLMQYNKEPFHILHALTVEGVMRWYAGELGYGGETDYWGISGLLHDIDFEIYPEEHCKKAPELLKAGGVSGDMVKTVCSHGYGICSDIMPEHTMEKVLFATDELTGLIFAAAKMRPSKSTEDMELSSLKKKFKDKKFAAGCSRDIIRQGAEMLGWELDELLEKTILAMRSCEKGVAAEMTELGLQ